MRVTLISLVGALVLTGSSCGDREPPVAVGSESASGSSTTTSGIDGTNTSPSDVPVLPAGCGDGVPESDVFCFELLPVRDGFSKGVTALDLDKDGADELLIGVDRSSSNDFDGRCDGQPDASSCMLVYKWDGTAMAEVSQRSGGLGGGFSYYPHTDVDGDGWVDVVIMDEASPTFGFRINQRGDGFVAYEDKYPGAPDFPEGDFLKGGVLPFKADGQGHVDLLVSLDEGLQVYARDGETWEPRGPLLPAPNCMMYPTARADIDEDGIEDVLVLGAYLACNVGPSYEDDPDFFALQVFRSNPATGQLDPLPLVHPGRIVDAFWIDDLDEDGHVDVLFDVYNGYEDPGVSLARGRGDGTFEDAEHWPNVEVQHLGDFDGDGDLDLRVAVEAYSVAFVDGLEAADAVHGLVERDLDADVKYGARAVGDFNGDGVTDLVASITDSPPDALVSYRTAVWISRP